MIIIKKLKPCKEQFKIKNNKYIRYFVKPVLTEKQLKMLCNEVDIKDCILTVLITNKDIEKIVQKLENIKQQIETENNINKQTIIRQIEEIIQTLKH